MSDSLWPHESQHARPPYHQLPEFTQTQVHRVSDAIQPSQPLSSPSLPVPNHPSIRVFSNGSTLCVRWPKYWSFSFSIIPSKEIPGLISFRMDWLELLETLFPHLFPLKWWDQMPWSSFSECWALSQLFHSPLSLSSRGFWVPLHFLP